MASYREALALRKLAAAEIGGITTKIEIEPATTRWAFSIMIVLKKDVLLRFFIDCRRLNAVIIRDLFSILRKNECIYSLRDTMVLSTLYTIRGHWYIEVEKHGREKTAPTKDHVVYRYMKTSFGLKATHATFQRTIVLLIAYACWQFTLVYSDYNIVVSEAPQDRIEQVWCEI